MKFKKIISVFLAAAVTLSLLTLCVSAASASFSLSGPGSVTVGSQVKVTVSLKGSEKIGSWRFSLNYDPAALEYVSGADSGGGGAVLFADSSDGVSSLSKTVVFRARRIGSVTVSVGGAQVVGFDSASNMGANAPSKKINIVAAPTLSAENNLSALTIAEGAFEPAFDAKNTSYTMTVPFEVAALTVSATPKDGKASVAVTGAEALVVGENKVNVTVTAENGKAKTYTVTVIRQESELAGVTAEVGGTTYSVAYDPATLQIPVGFTPSTAQLGEKKILTYTSPKESVSIAYLYTESDGAWYVFDQEGQNFKTFQTLTGAANTVVVLEPKKNVEIPKGFIPKSITVGEQAFPGYQASNSEDAKMYLVYGMASDGTVGFFFYDATYNTFTSYFVPEDPEQKDAVKEAMALSNLLDDSEKKADRMEIIALAVGVLAALLLIGLIISLATRKKSKKSEPDERISSVSEQGESDEPDLFKALEEERQVKEMLDKSLDEDDVGLVFEEKNETEETIGDLPIQKKKIRKAKRTFSEIGKKDE